MGILGNSRVYRPRAWTLERIPCVGTLALPLTSFVTMSTPLNFSKTQVLYL